MVEAGIAREQYTAWLHGAPGPRDRVPREFAAAARTIPRDRRRQQARLAVLTRVSALAISRRPGTRLALVPGVVPPLHSPPSSPAPRLRVLAVEAEAPLRWAMSEAAAAHEPLVVP